MVQHGQLYLRDQVPPRSTAYDDGKFGRLFPWLPPFTTKPIQVVDDLLELGKLGGIMDAADPPQPPKTLQLVSGPTNTDNPAIFVGFTFLGQFLDHDVTFDPTSSLERQTDPESIQNFRTPSFELDSVYGSGRAASPHLYDKTTQNQKFLIDAAAPNDLPRNSQTIAIIGDPRNDENTILSQLQLAFLKFHNAVIDLVHADGITDPNEAFTEAQRLVRWHYQWIILHEFLPTTVGQPLVDDILENGRRFYNWRNAPFIPVEFSVAAYRFGHSQVRPSYAINRTGNGGDPFTVSIFDASLDPTDPDPEDLRGGKRADRRFVEWNVFFDDLGSPPRRNKLIDTTLSSPLFTLIFGAPGQPGNNPLSLAQRNLLRHLTFSLPSGQDVANAMGEEPLDVTDLSDLVPLGLATKTPLWFYILRESEVRTGGTRLGPVGGRIVAEVFIGLLKGDHMSFLRQFPGWKPTLGTGGEFAMSDLLKTAGVA